MRQRPDRSRPRAAIVRLAGLALGLALGTPAPGSAAILPVTDCGDTGLSGQLRQVLATAAQGDVVTVPPCTIVVTSQLSILTGLALQGSGAGRTVLDGGGATGVLFVGAGSYGARIADLTIRNGNLPGGGAGMFTNGNTVELDRVVVSGNQAAGGSGAGIFHGFPGRMWVRRSTIAGNLAPAGSAAALFHNGGEVTIEDSSIVDNHADGSGLDGGGIFNGGGSVLAIVNSLVAGNTTGGRGGGIYDNSGVLVAISSTFDGNAAARGGAIRLSVSSRSTLVNATVTGNTASQAGGAFEADGGGAPVTLLNTAVAGNTAPLGATCAAPGAAVSAGHNLADDGSCALAGPDDQESVDPLLGLLQDNGGPTLTRALLAGSPALDAADPVGCPGADQRGVPRPQGPRCDVGAFEAPPPEPPPPPPSPLTLSPPSGSYLSTQTLDFGVALALPGRTVVGGQALLDGGDVTPAVLACIRPGVLLAGGAAFHCPGIPAALLGPGSHTVAVSLVLDDGATVSQSVVWTVLPASGP